MDFARPDGGTLTALRLGVRPDDEATAVVLPELGFVLSQLRVQRVEAEKGTNAGEIPLTTACDEDPDSFFPAESSIDKYAQGWSAHPRIHRRRTAVFVAATGMTQADSVPRSLPCVDPE